MKCFYHVDADGICAGFWVDYFEDRKVMAHAKRKFYLINYGMEFPLGDIEPGEKIYIVDYSIEPEEMDKLLEITDDVVWIDHHKTAIAKYKDYPKNIAGIRYDGIAGCELTWAWFAKCDEGKKEFAPDMLGTGEPYFTQLIGDYDVWKFKYGNDSKYFNLAFNAAGFSPEELSMRWLFDNSYVKELIGKGKTIEAFLKSNNKEYCESYGFETEFEGHKAYALNRAMCGSDTFHSVNDGSYDLFIGFAFDGNGWSYALRSDKIDVSEIAAKYGGGGHSGAAGFRSKELLIRKREK